MNNRARVTLSLVTLIMLAVVTSVPATAQFYKQSNLVSDISGMAALTDSNLVNPWGVTHSPTSPFWVSDAGKSVSTLYRVDPTSGAVTKASLTVNVPVPSGTLFNGSTDFVVTSGAASGSAAFIFSGLNGNIYGWNPSVPPPPPSTQAQLGATGTPPPAAYTGITMATQGGNRFLYAANPAGNRIDVFDAHFNPIIMAGGFVDPTLPAGINPFNIANINGQLFVTYAPMGGLAFGPGAIDVFNTDGAFVRRFNTGLKNPWGMVVAPSNFGKFANALLVGTFNRGDSANGPGNISAFDLASGELLGLLEGTDSKPLAIDGLWQLIFGNGGSGGNPSVLYFSAGIQNETHGLFASLSTCHGPMISNASASPNVLWPPNNQPVPVTVNYSVSDDCDPAPACSLSVATADSGGGVDKSPNSTVVDAHTVELLASREGGGTGRVYTISISCTDKLPLSASTTVTVTVPHDQHQ